VVGAEEGGGAVAGGVEVEDEGLAREAVGGSSLIKKTSLPISTGLAPSMSKSPAPVAPPPEQR